MSKSWLKTPNEQLRDFGDLFDRRPIACGCNFGDHMDGCPLKLARNTDPPTSHKAAETVVEFKGEHHRKIYEALKTMKDGTFYEIAEVAGMPPSSVWRRLNELEKSGRIITTGEERHGNSGRMCRIWKIR